jgi:hypothetical protein
VKKEFEKLSWERVEITLKLDCEGHKSFDPCFLGSWNVQTWTQLRATYNQTEELRLGRR